MGTRRVLVIFFLFMAAAASFVWRTAASLPPVVASHFAGSGAANGFMPRQAYVSVLLLLVVGTPLLVAFLPFAFIGKQGAGLNIPNRAHWLAPERRDETIGYLRSHGVWLAFLVGAFLVYVHWLVVQANLRQPPILSGSALVAGLVVFFSALVAWLSLLFRRFRARA